MHIPELPGVFSEPDFPPAHCLQELPLPRCSGKTSPEPGAGAPDLVWGPLEAPLRTCLLFLLPWGAQGPFLSICTP